ncbi:hypothetical protein D3C72_529610 [compost metagenome]
MTGPHGPWYKMAMPSMPIVLAFAGLFLPLVLALLVYDVRWIVLAVRARQTPPWGAFARIFAAFCCHGGVMLLAFKSGVWPEKTLTFWLHMTLDPGLTFYAVGLYDLYSRMANRQAKPAVTEQG